MGKSDVARELMAQYNAQLTKANRANKKRYKQAKGLAKRGGRSEIMRARRQGAEERGNIYQSLIQRGLGSTSLTAALQQRSRESQRMNIAGIRDQRRGNLQSIIASRTDQAPQFGPYAGIISQLYADEEQPNFWEQILGSIGGAAAGGIGSGLGAGLGGLVQKLF